MESGRGALERYENEEQEISPLTDQKVQNPKTTKPKAPVPCAGACLLLTAPWRFN